MRFNWAIVALAIVLATAGCADSGYGPKQTFGGLGGAAVGGRRRLDLSRLPSPYDRLRTPGLDSWTSELDVNGTAARTCK